MDFLQLEGKRVLIFGVANRKSVAWHIAKTLTEAGAQCVHVVQNEAVREAQARLLGEADVYLCDVEQPEQIARLREDLAAKYDCFHGLVHSIAFADYSEGMKPFHETPRKAFLQAVDISCYSLIAVCNELKELLDPDASVVTISISTTRMASENYGFMAPVKAALDSSIAFLAKSFSQFSRVRFNAVCPRPAQDIGIGRDTRLRRLLSVCGGDHPSQEGRSDTGSCRCGGLPAESPFQRDQRPAGRG